MSEGFAPSEQSERMAQLAQLPPGDPGRQELESVLASLAPAEQEYWRSAARQTDCLFAELSRNPMPGNQQAALHERLLALTFEHPHAAGWTLTCKLAWNRILQTQVGWPAMASAAAVVIAAAAFLLWQPMPALLGPLNEQVAQTIVDRAVQNASGSALEVASGDAKAVQKALSAHALPFPVVILQPQVKLDLRGGGVCDFGGTPAVYTRWQDDGGVNYTVYQFNGKPLGAPAAFLRTSEVPRQLWRGNAHYHVIIWPGSGVPCTWVVVMDSDAAMDAFDRAY